MFSTPLHAMTGLNSAHSMLAIVTVRASDTCPS